MITMSKLYLIDILKGVLQLK
ncbi:MAG: hypothetical protein K0R55_2722, partial [Sporomusa sp.]|nr:hypothetical protein [Sporomusa sp.]